MDRHTRIFLPTLTDGEYIRRKLLDYNEGEVLMNPQTYFSAKNISYGNKKKRYCIQKLEIRMRILCSLQDTIGN